MPIEELIIEAKKTIPSSLVDAHAWLHDMLSSHHQLNDPVAAVRFFMLGLFAGNAISLDTWHEFDSLIALKKKEDLH